MVNIRTPWVFQDLVQELDRMTRDPGWPFAAAGGLSDPALAGLDIRDDEASLTLDLPGVGEEDLDLVLEDNRLRVEARREDVRGESEEVVLRERSYGEFSRDYLLPWTVREEDVDARFERGVLRLTLKRAPEAAPRRIQVKSA